MLLNSGRLSRLAQQSAINSDIPSVNAVIDNLLNATVYHQPEKGLALLVQQRVNQQVVEHLLALWHQKGLASEVRAEVYVALKDLGDWLEDRADSKKYRQLAAQYLLLASQIEFSLEQGKQVTPVSEVKLPPGSPIGS